MKWLFAIAGALLLQGALLLFLLGMELPAIPVLPKAAQGVPVVFREMRGNSKQSAVTPAAEKPATKAKKAAQVIAKVTNEVSLGLVQAKAEQAAVVTDPGDPSDAGVEQASGEGAAEGSGQDDGAGTEGTEQVQNGGSPRNDLSLYGAAVIARIAAQQRVTPQMQRLRLQGTALVTVQIAKDGKLVASGLAESAGHALLDAEALRMVNLAAPFAPLPADFAESSASFSVPIRFRPTAR